jgi:hypothetical protein
VCSTYIREMALSLMVLPTPGMLLIRGVSTLKQ